MEDQFYVYLPSNDSSFIENKISNFRTLLAKPHSLRGKWEVALTSISMFKRWKTFEDSKIFIRKLFGFISKDDIEIEIEGKILNSESELVNIINTSINRAFYELENKSQSLAPKISFDYKNRVFKLTTGYGSKSGIYVVEFENSLKDILNFKDIEIKYNPDDLRSLYLPDDWITFKNENTKRFVVEKVKDINLDEVLAISELDHVKELKEKKKEEFFQKLKEKDEIYSNVIAVLSENSSHKKFVFSSANSVVIDHLYRNMFVYCDIVMPSFVGSSYTKLLRIVRMPIDAKYGEHIDIEFDKFYYVLLSVTDFQTVEIDIKDEFDKNVAFEFGTCIVTLHFRKIQ